MNNILCPSNLFEYIGLNLVTLSRRILDIQSQKSTFLHVPYNFFVFPLLKKVCIRRREREKKEERRKKKEKKYKKTLICYVFHVYIIFPFQYTLQCVYHQKFSFHPSPYHWPQLPISSSPISLPHFSGKH